MNEASKLLRALRASSPLNLIYVLGMSGHWVMALPVAAMADLSVWIWNQLVKLIQVICLDRDLEAAEGWVRRFIKTLLTENQFSALTSFTFNVGAGALQSSTLRMKLNRGEYEGALNEFPK